MSLPSLNVTFPEWKEEGKGLLLDPWVQRVDPQNQRNFWYNEDTHQRSWAKPMTLNCSDPINSLEKNSIIKSSPTSRSILLLQQKQPEALSFNTERDKAFQKRRANNAAYLGEMKRSSADDLNLSLTTLRLGGRRTSFHKFSSEESLISPPSPLLVGEHSLRLPVGSFVPSPSTSTRSIKQKMFSGMLTQRSKPTPERKPLVILTSGPGYSSLHQRRRMEVKPKKNTSVATGQQDQETPYGIGREMECGSKNVKFVEYSWGGILPFASTQPSTATTKMDDIRLRQDGLRRKFAEVSDQTTTRLVLSPPKSSPPPPGLQRKLVAAAAAGVTSEEKAAATMPFSLNDSLQ